VGFALSVLVVMELYKIVARRRRALSGAATA
jgi:hypothetical protein